MVRQIFKPLFLLSAFLSTPLWASSDNIFSKLDLWKAFSASPVIYSTLILMSIGATLIWLYSLFTLKISEMMPSNFMLKIREQLIEKRFESALMTCQNEPNFSSNVIACGIATRKHGPQVMMESMQAEGKRCGNSLWQRITILSDVATVAPMLGLLGTVLGMFYAFYDVNRSSDTITSIFDGLGVAMGTTVFGLFVAILSMVFHTTLKYRIVNLLGNIENEALSLGSLIDSNQVPIS